MCITSRRAILEATKIISFRKEDGNVFLAYSNSVQNQSEGRNVMLLPIPGEVVAFHDTRAYNLFLNEIAQQTTVSEYLNYGVRSRGVSRGMLKGIKRTTVGQYEILHTNDIAELKDALRNEEVVVTAEILNFFIDHYKGYTIVACLFDSKDKIDAQPIALEYKPFSDKLIFFPAMDAHNGDAPRRGQVEVDHSIIVEDNTHQLETPGNVEYTQPVPDFIKEVNFGTFQLDGRYDNGDFYQEELIRPNLKRSFETLIQQPEKAF
jgi:hypothetical protein